MLAFFSNQLNRTKKRRTFGRQTIPSPWWSLWTARALRYTCCVSFLSAWVIFCPFLVLFCSSCRIFCLLFSFYHFRIWHFKRKWKKAAIGSSRPSEYWICFVFHAGLRACCQVCAWADTQHQDQFKRQGFSSLFSFFVFAFSKRVFTHVHSEMSWRLCFCVCFLFDLKSFIFSRQNLYFSFHLLHPFRFLVPSLQNCEVVMHEFGMMLHDVL